MKNFTICIFILLLAGFSANAQLLDRTNYDGTITLNSRPVAGDAALQFVIPIVDLSDTNGTDAGIYKGNSLISGDLLTFKYYKTNNDVYRAAIRLYSDNARTKGVGADSSFFNPIDEDMSEVEESFQRSVRRQYTLALGMEKHYSSSNIFDVYGGTEILIGLGKNRTISEETFTNGDKLFVTATTPTTIIGFGIVAGFNVFVAELPISIGLEYGLTGKWMFGGVTHVEREEDIDALDVNETTEYYTQATDAFGNPDLNLIGGQQQYSSLKKRQFNMDTNNNVRLNIHIYFNSSRD